MKDLCILCKNKFFDNMYIINGYKIVKCKSCDLVFTNPMPSRKELNKIYNNYKFEAGFDHEFYIRKDAVRTLKTLASLGYFKKSLFDVGCGAGFLMDEARKKGWTTFGIDTGNIPIKYAKSKLKLNVIRGDFLKLNYSKKFKVITLIQVIEHLTDPYEILKKISSYLSNDGILVIATPNINSVLSKVLNEKFNYMIPPEHVIFYSPDTLKKIIEEAGYKVIKIISYGYPDDLSAIYRFKKEKKINKKLLLKSNSLSMSKNALSHKKDGDQSIVKKIKNFLFEKIIRQLFYPLLNLGLNGSMIEIYAIKSK